MGAGGTKGKQGQAKVPTKQHPADAGWGRTTMDGLDRLQRRRSLRRQRRRVPRRPQHARVHRHEPADVAVPRYRLLREAIGDWCHSGHDHWPCVHHSCRRYVIYTFVTSHTTYSYNNIIVCVVV